MNGRLFYKALLIATFVYGCTESDALEHLLYEKQECILREDSNIGLNDVQFSPSVLKKHRLTTKLSASKWLSNKLIDTIDVLDHVLPHRVNYVYDRNWREEVQNRFGQMAFSAEIASAQELILLCNKINDSLKRDIVFGVNNEDERFFKYSDYTLNGKGTCLAMCDYANYTFRTIGLPVTTDFVPVWGNLNTAGHSWNTLLSKDKPRYFMGCESNIGDFEPLIISRSDIRKTPTLRIPAKVYRLSKYSEKSQNLFGLRILDVTHEYVNVKNICVRSKGIGYEDVFLSTYNRGQYNINSIGEKRDNMFSFKNMALKLLYFPVELKGSIPFPIAYPILCSEERNEVKKPDFTHTIGIEVDHLTSLAQGQHDFLTGYGYDFLQKVDIHNKYKVCPLPTEGKVYELYYWDFGWNMHEQIRCDSDKLHFRNVPKNAVYAVKAKGDSFQSVRPFTVKDNAIEWF